MTWEQQLQNCIINDTSISRKKLHLTPYMPNTTECTFQFTNDYLREDEYMPVLNLIHRYRNKAVIIATNQCACYCQFCTRQRITRNGEISLDNFEKILGYIKEHPEIEDILVTGGDPLILNTRKIVTILQEIQKIDSVKIMRIGTRIPITLPQRINTELVRALKKFNNFHQILYLICDYPHKHYTFKHFEV